MKKKIIISAPIFWAVCALLLLAVLFVPYRHREYNDGGTEEWAAVTYKVIKWNRTEDYIDEQGELQHCTLQKTSVYWGADRYKTIYQLFSMEVDYDDNLVECYKPVIYLYPEMQTEVSVKLTLSGELTCTYPKYENGWRVTAAPDGTLVGRDGKEYTYLYWEGETNAAFDTSRGFCVKGEDTAAFLEEALEKLGLNRREANEFIVYWLPLMQENEYNIISFQAEAYTDAAVLEVTPAPDTVIRVFMTYTPSETYVEIEAQELSAPERSGFTVVEWGGAHFPSGCAPTK